MRAQRPDPEAATERDVTVHIPTPFALASAPRSAEEARLHVEYERKRAELDAVLERLLLLPPRHAHRRPFAEAYEALEKERDRLRGEVRALEAALQQEPGPGPGARAGEL